MHRQWYPYQSARPSSRCTATRTRRSRVRDFTFAESTVGRLLPIRWENQGVCTWALCFDGSDDPPVLVDVDSEVPRGNCSPNTSRPTSSCVLDYHVVLRQPALVQAQNSPISSESLRDLAGLFDEGPRTSGWPGNTAQYRFAGSRLGVLIWSMEDQADWFGGAADATSLESALRLGWELDAVGESFYDCSKIGRDRLAKLKAEAS